MIYRIPQDAWPSPKVAILGAWGLSLNKHFGRSNPAKIAKHVYVCIACQYVKRPIFMGPCFYSYLYSSSGRNIIEYVGGMGMDYMTLKEASEKWCVSTRQINYYCIEGRIPGAIKMATIWLLPKDAVKPIDRRRNKRGGSCDKGCDM